MKMRLILKLAAVALVVVLFCPAAVLASALATLSGTVTDSAGTPVSSAVVTLTGNNLVLHTRTDGSGHFAFASLDPASYQLAAQAAPGIATMRVDLSSSGAAVTLQLLKTISSSRTVGLPPTRGSGTDLTLSGNYINKLPSGRDLSGILLQLPGAARGANGVVHINGDHGDINYIVDGVAVPQELNREVGSEFDPSDISFIDVLQGAYPAQYGGRFASVVNITTRAGNTTTPGFDFSALTGSYAHTDLSAGYHGRIGSGTFDANLRGERGDRFLDPPNPNSPHNDGSNVNEFFRYTAAHGNDFTNVTISQAYRTYQIPVDVDRGAPASTDDNESQNDLFAVIQHHHATANGSSVEYGVGYKRSQIRDFPDQANDFAYGETLNLANGGTPSDCANGTVPACAFSLFADRTARDVIANIDGDVPSRAHDVRYGTSYDVATVDKLYAITLQPNNFISPAAATVTDAAPNVGHTMSTYLQDSWRMGSLWQLDYGLRNDFFQITSTQFDQGFGMFSPRVKLTRNLGARANVYAYYGRFFTPFSLENVSPSAAQQLNAPLQATVAQFDLKPQRDSVYEMGGHLPLGSGVLGLRVMQKNATDLIDDTQVGVTALHQDINYAQGRISSQSAYYQQPLANSGRFYASLTHTRSVNKGCETQLLAPCFGAPTDWTPADHDQRWDASSGVVLNDAHGGWFTVDGEYGSGLSSAYCQPASSECKVPPHVTFDAERGVALGNTVLTVRIINMFNDRYRVTYLNAQGDHYAPPRTFEFSVGF